MHQMMLLIAFWGKPFVARLAFMQSGLGYASPLQGLTHLFATKASVWIAAPH